MAAHRVSFVRMGYMEYGELYDAYDAGVCDAQVGESSRSGGRQSQRKPALILKAASLPSRSRLFPMFATTPARDPQWSAIVAWAIYTLERAELAGDAMGGVGPRFLRRPGR